MVSCAYAPFNRGGVGDSLSSIVASMIDQGHDVSIFTIEDSKKIKKYQVRNVVVKRAPCRIVNIPGSSTDFFSRYTVEDYYNKKVERIFTNFVNENNFDLIHFHAIQKIGANLLNVSSKIGIKSVVTFHDFWWVCQNLFYTDVNYGDCSRDCNVCHKQLQSISKDYKATRTYHISRREYLTKQLEKANVIIGNSKFLTDEISTWDIPKVLHLENGIDECDIGTIKEKSREGPMVIGFVGGQNELKGYDVLIEAFTELADRDIELHIYGVNQFSISQVGSDWRGFVSANSLMSLPRKILERIQRVKQVESADKRIFMHAPFSSKEKYEIYKTFDVVIVGTKVMESFSLVTREAQVLNIPVITSNCGGPLDIIKEGLNGYIYDRNNPSSLRKAIVQAKNDWTRGRQFQFDGDIRFIKDQVKDLLEVYTKL